MIPILDRYKDGGVTAHLYRWLRLERGGLRALAGEFPDRGLIVDLGCGVGLLAHVLVEDRPSRRVLAVDHSARRVASLTESAAGLEIEARQADMAEIAIPPCAGVALVDVLHYLEADAQERLLERAVNALEPGGAIVVRDPDASAGMRYGIARAHERVAVAFGLTKAGIGHYRSGTEWAFLLRALGLAVRVFPLPRLSPYANRIVVGTRP